MGLKEHIFRAYDIRGIYGVDLDENVAETIGKAFGTFIGGSGKTVAVGYDVRLSSRSLKDSAVKGLLSVGVNVVDIGLVPTPIVYFTISHFVLDGGIVVSASHNPPQWNGFKLCKEKGMICGSGMGMEQIHDIALKGEFPVSPTGKVEDWREKVLKEYETFLLGKVKIAKKINVLVDMGNGSCSQYADKIMEKAGLNVKTINNVPDGRFPSRSPEPTEESLGELIDKMSTGKYDLGVAFDGDGDRTVFVDDRGRVIEGDRMLALYMKHFIKTPGEKVIYEVSCSKVIEDIAKEKKAKTIVTRVGHSFLLEKMIKEGALFGGESSSHLYFKEVYGLDDAIFASLKAAQLVSQIRSKFSEMVDTLPKYIIRRKVYNVSDKIKFIVMDKLSTIFMNEGFKTTTIDGVRVDTDKGWFIIRASNTQPQIKASAEAIDQETLDFYEKTIESKLSKAMNEMK